MGKTHVYLLPLLYVDFVHRHDPCPYILSYSIVRGGFEKNEIFLETIFTVTHFIYNRLW